MKGAARLKTFIPILSRLSKVQIRRHSCNDTNGLLGSKPHVGVLDSTRERQRRKRSEASQIQVKAPTI